jgi:hypothetical protein
MGTTGAGASTNAELASTKDLAQWLDAHQFVPIEFTKLHYLQRTLWPVMLPAHDYVASLNVMLMQNEIAAFVFKFNPLQLPSVPVHPA